MNQRRPCAVDPFTAVKRVFADHGLTPALNTVAMHCNQENPSAVGAPKAGFKKVDQRHVNLTECNGFDFHLFGFTTSRTARRKIKLLYMAVPPRWIYPSDAYDQFSSQCPSKNFPFPA